MSLHALVYRQLTGAATGAVPSKKVPATGVTFNVGGSGVTNCVTVLRRSR